MVTFDEMGQHFNASWARQQMAPNGVMGNMRGATAFVVPKLQRSVLNSFTCCLPQHVDADSNSVVDGTEWSNYCRTAFHVKTGIAPRYMTCFCGSMHNALNTTGTKLTRMGEKLMTVWLLTEFSTFSVTDKLHLTSIKLHKSRMVNSLKTCNFKVATHNNYLRRCMTP